MLSQPIVDAFADGKMTEVGKSEKSPSSAAKRYDPFPDARPSRHRELVE
jgi:hypothetical protein